MLEYESEYIEAEGHFQGRFYQLDNLLKTRTQSGWRLHSIISHTFTRAPHLVLIFEREVPQ